MVALLATNIFDHAKAVKELLRASVDCYMSFGTAEALGVTGHHRAHVLNAKKTYIFSTEILSHPRMSFTSWHIVPFTLQHDCAEGLGFIIGQGNDRLLFIPDTAYVKDRFAGVTHLVVECNHIEDILSENIKKSGVNAMVGRRARRNHMSLGTLINFIKANNLSESLREIHLIHLSDANSDEKRMIDEVQALTGVPTYAA